MNYLKQSHACRQLQHHASLFHASHVDPLHAQLQSHAFVQEALGSNLWEEQSSRAHGACAHDDDDDDDHETLTQRPALLESHALCGGHDYGHDDAHHACLSQALQGDHDDDDDEDVCCHACHPQGLSGGHGGWEAHDACHRQIFHEHGA